MQSYLSKTETLSQLIELWRFDVAATDGRQDHTMQSDALQEFYSQRGFSGRVGFGERPAVLVIDLAKGWTTPYPASPIGSDLSGVLEQTGRILEPARRAGIPVFFTTMAYEPGLIDAGTVQVKKLSHMQHMIKGSEWVQLHPSLKRQPDEVFIIKQRASAFFGTTLLSQLIAQKIDTVIITGCSTSGCVRATAQDAFDYNLHVVVPREAVGDRSPTAHEANLFDINARHGDVVSVAEVLDYLKKIKTSAGSTTG